MTPVVGVVVPVYKQPQFLAGAVLSALDQAPPVAVRVVIVDDGCPYPGTRAAATALRDAHPGRVASLRQANAGLPAARNAGIEHALATWPEIDAIFPLDADNLLSPGTLGALWGLLEARPDLDWATPALELFGGDGDFWETAPPFTVYRQLFDNQCDAGTLFRRSVFDSGLRYDVGMPAFEDWLFVLQAALRGFTGEQAGAVGFRYRQRAHSMLHGAQREHGELHALIRARVPAAYAPAELVRREHAEAPRFALVHCDSGATEATAAVDLPPARGTLAELAAAGPGTERDAPYVPPIAVLGSAPLFAWLERTRLLGGVLLLLQSGLRAGSTVALRLHADPDPDALRIALGPAAGGPPASALCTRTRTLHASPHLPVDVALDLHVGAAHAAPGAALDWAPVRAAVAAASGLAGAAPAAPPARTLSAFGAHLHVDELQTTFPCHRAVGALWVVASETADRPAALALAAAVRRLDPDAALQLLLTGAQGADVAPDALAPFDGVTLLAGPDRLALVERVLAGAGTVVLADDGADAYEILRRAGGPQTLRVALVRDHRRDARPAPAGDALAIAEDDALLDAYLVPSPDVRLQLENLGAVPDKITLLPDGDDGARALHAALATARERRA
jgi:hypothetical protein